MSLRTKESQYQASPTPSSRRYPTDEVVRGLPGEIRCRPKHSTTLVAGFVAVRRTPSTRTFLSHLIVPTKLNIQRYLRARNPCGWDLKIFSAIVSSMFPTFSGKLPTLLLVVCDLCVVV